MLLVVGPIFVGKYALMTAGSEVVCPRRYSTPIKIMPPYNPAFPRAAQHKMPAAEARHSGKADPARAAVLGQSA